MRNFLTRYIASDLPPHLFSSHRHLPPLSSFFSSLPSFFLYTLLFHLFSSLSPLSHSLPLLSHTRLHSHQVIIHEDITFFFSLPPCTWTLQIYLKTKVLRYLHLQIIVNIGNNILIPSASKASREVANFF